MAVVERVTQEDLVLYEILRNPVLFFEFIMNYDKLEGDEEFELTVYQKEFMLDFNHNVSISCARSVGKTAALSGLILWCLIFNVFPDDYIVYTVPNRVHLEPVWVNYLVKLLRGNSFLQHFLDPNRGVNGSTFTITTKLGSSLICRIAGTSGTGANVVGLHTPFVILDESAFYPYKTFLELQPVIKTFTKGNRLIVSGVPNGIREKNVNWHCQNENKDYSKHHVSAFDNPRFTEIDKQKAIETYGGEDSDDYVHNVLGLPGRPIFALFDRELMAIEEYPVYKLAFDGSAISDNIVEYINKLSILPSIPDRKYPVFMGVDLGVTEPTAIFILYADNYGRIRFHAKIQLTRVNYYLQERILDFLFEKFSPILVAIDEGNAGRAVIPNLINSPEYSHKKYDNILYPVNFSGNTDLGINADGSPISMRTKPLAVNILQDYSNQHKIIYSSTDLETVAELERMTYTKTPAGEVVFRTLTERGGKRGDDHFTSALLCFCLAYYVKNEFKSFRKGKAIKLGQPRLNVWSINYVNNN